jgi:starch-binding outer membrane protein, SusD/RagB family
MQSVKIFASCLIAASLIFTSCKKIIEPDNDNHSTTSRLYKDPAFAEGVMLNGYNGLPYGYNLDEVATDDAVTNVKGSWYQKMATGEWSAMYDPLSVWNSSYQTLYYMNYFLSIVNEVQFAWDDRNSSPEVRDSLFKRRFTGEARILRAWYNFELLRNHGGIANDGTPQGFIILTAPPDRNANYNKPRNSYDECVQFILDDLNSGISLLPNTYADKAGNVAYNIVFGNTNNKNKNRIDGRFAKALKSRVLLHAASQPFYTASAKWDSAAVAAARLLTITGGGINGTTGMSTHGKDFWAFPNDQEIIFRRDFELNNNREIADFPPSRYGHGQTNPSQNLVDAFPMANGFPISDPSSGFDPASPYANRDPRLAAFVVYNGNVINGATIYTSVDDPKDGLNQTVTSTRTGYYLKKLLNSANNLTPEIMSTGQQFYTIFRYTEIFLNYAEAANEAWGPDLDPNGYGFTPRTIIAAIRKRGGIAPTDPYLATITSQADMRKLIQNERRIELCFEGFRFWDIRRWGLDLTETVKGISISGNTYTPIDVEGRLYRSYMNHGPIPYQETLKSNLTLQNLGW